MINNLGSVIIEAPNSLGQSDRLQEEFDLLSFLDFCSVLDAAVLHEELHAFCWREAQPGLGSLLDILKANPVSESLYGSGILKVHEFLEHARQELERVNEHPINIRIINSLLIDPSDEHISRHFSKALWHAKWLATNFIYESEYHIPSIPSFHSAQLYLAAPNIMNERRAVQFVNYSLAEKYKDFKEALFQLRASVEGDDFVRIPPIAFEILNRAESFYDIPGVLLEVRDRYSTLRRRFVELEQVLGAEDIPLKKKLKEKAKICHSLNLLIPQSEGAETTVLTSLALRSNEISKVEGLSDGLDFMDLRWDKLISTLIQKGSDLFWKLKLRPLHSTKKIYLTASPKDIGNLIEKHFDHRLCDDDYKQVRDYRDYIQKCLDPTIKKKHKLPGLPLSLINKGGEWVEAYIKEWEAQFDS